MLRCLSISRRFAQQKPRPIDMLKHEHEHNPYWPHIFPEAGEINPGSGGKPPATNWVESLLQKYQKPKVEEPFRTEDTLKHFVEGYKTPRGPIKWMKSEEKEKVHQMIDLKMVQLEETGLSREEILYNKPGGIPLAFDPVFQLLKNNKVAREMLVKEGTEFTVDSVLAPALHQDFGIDRSKALPNKDEKYAHQLSSSYENSILARLHPDDRIKSEDYYWRANLQSKLRALQLYSEASTVLFPRPLESRRKLKAFYGRTVNIKDINVRNPALLAKFMASTGKIRNQWVTKLPRVIQKKIAKTIKQCRQLHILPYVGFLQPHHKKPLHGPHHQSSHVYLHSETGIMFANDKIEALRENNKPEESTFMRKLVENYKQELSEEDLVSNFQRQKAAENFPFRTAEMLSSAELDLLEALNYTKKDGGEGKFAYETVKKVMDGKSLSPGDISEWLVQERACSTDLYANQGKTAVKGNLEKLLAELNQAKTELGLKPCPETVLKKAGMKPRDQRLKRRK